MISTFDKFLVAALGAIAYALNTWGGLSLDPDLVNQIIAGVTAILVYVVPNRPAPLGT